MTRKKLTGILAAVMAATMIGGCGDVRDEASYIPIPEIVNTVPVTEEVPSSIGLQAVKEQTFGYDYCIHTDGTVSVWGDDGSYVRVLDRGWTDIVAVVRNGAGYVGLRSDGTLVTTMPETQEAQVMSEWENIVHIHAYGGYGSIVGLNTKGEVLYAGGDIAATQWTGITQLVSGDYGLFGLKADGSVVSENSQADVSGWSDVIQLAEGMGFLAGLRSDGTVLYSGTDEMLGQEISSWTNVVKLSAYHDLMGLRADGTVAATQSFFDYVGMEMDVPLNDAEWTNVVDICVWGGSYLGLRADGTVLAAGLNEGGQLNVGHWRNIQAVVIDNYTTFGLTEEGILLKSVSEYDTEGKEIVAFDVCCPEE